MEIIKLGQNMTLFVFNAVESVGTVNLPCSSAYTVDTSNIKTRIMFNNYIDILFIIYVRYR